MTHQVTELNRQNGQLTHQAAELNRQNGQLNQRAAELNRQNGQLNQRAAELDAHEKSLYAELRDRDIQIGSLNRSVESFEKRASDVLSSWSWRVTAPVRWISRPLLERKKNGIPHTVAVNTRPVSFQPQPQPQGRARREQDIPRDSQPSLPEKWDHRCTPYGIVCLPIIDWHFRFQRPQQMARCFAAARHPVLYVNQQFSNKFEIDRIEDGIHGLTLPGRRNTNVYQEMPTDAEADGMAEAIVRYISSTADHPWVCIIQLPFWRPVAERLRSRAGYYIIYDCMDDHAGFSTNAQIMLAAEADLLRNADLVLASSQLLYDKVAPIARRSELIRNAVDYDHFAGVPDTIHAADKGMTVGYYGAIADWFDSQLVADMAGLQPQWRFVLIGNTFSADTATLTACPNILLAGEKPYAELPTLITAWDCCIIPFKRCSLTEATNPVKIYEMLAAGKPVISVRLPELHAIAEAGYIGLADTAEEFICEIARQVAHDDTQRQADRRAFASENTWQIRQQALDQAICDLYPLVSIIVVTYNNLALNRLCIESIYTDTDYPNYEVIVVDNGSTDGTQAYLQGLAFQGLTVILNSGNEGFAAANNQGLRKANGRYLCLLNNDTVVSGAWLSTLVAHLAANPKIGLIGPVTNAIANEAQIEVGYQDLRDMPAWSRNYCRQHRGALQDISMLAFFCVVMPRSVFAAVGAMDERYEIGMFEDDDYNRRVREAGYQVQLAGDAFVHHWQRASFKLIGEEKYLQVYHDNEKRYHAKWAVNPITGTDAQKMAELVSASKSARETFIFAPSIGWSVHLFQRPQHLARVLAQDGYLVIYDCCNSGDDVTLLKEIEPRLYLFNGEPELFRVLENPVLWTFTYNYDYIDHFPAGTRVIYDWIDDLAVFPYDQNHLARLHARALQEATLVVSVARKLHESALQTRPDAVYLPNAVEDGRFDHPPTPNPALADKAFSRLASAGKPIAGYYGALAHWFDYDLLATVAGLRPDWTFVLIGPDHDGSMNRSRIGEYGNIAWLGPRDYETLPGYLHLFDVAMIPFKINDITLATSPLKLFEYFAGQKPVVATPMPECAAFEEVSIAEDAEAFAALLDIARKKGREPDFMARLAALARENSWQARAQTAIAGLSVNELAGKKSMTSTGEAQKNITDALTHPIPEFFKEWLYRNGVCNVCGQPARFFFQDTALFRESLTCEHCSSTSRYRSIARGVLTAIKEITGVYAPALAKLPHSGVHQRIRIYDTQAPFSCQLSAYPIPEYLKSCEWIEVHLSSYNSSLSPGVALSSGVTNQNVEQLTYPDEYFDIVITSDVMEHVRLDDRAHQQIARVLRSGGIYLFTVPHNRDWKTNQIRVRVDDPEQPEKDVFLMEPEYHGDANSSDCGGILSYRAYGRELDDKLAVIGMHVVYTKQDFPDEGVFNTELFYCRKESSSVGG